MKSLLKITFIFSVLVLIGCGKSTKKNSSAEAPVKEKTGQDAADAAAEKAAKREAALKRIEVKKLEDLKVVPEKKQKKTKNDKSTGAIEDTKSEQAVKDIAVNISPKKQPVAVTVSEKIVEKKNLI